MSRIDPNGPYLASGATIEYEYDGAGNRTSVKTPAGVTQYEYDEQNRLEKVIDPDLVETKYFYDAGGNLERTELPNGVVETRAYDELNRLKLLAYQRNGVTLQSFDYSLDPVDHRKVVTEQNGRKVEYEYEDLYRLTKETIFAPAGAVERTISYGYDAVGNRLSKTDSVGGVTAYIYDDNDRLLKEELRQNGVLVGSVEYRYDANGNTTRKVENGTQETVYTWNQEKRLVAVQTPAGENISYAYDADGVRVSKTVNGVTTEYLVDSNRDYAQVLEERVNDALIASYLYGLDLIGQERGNADSYYLVDGLGSTRGLTDGAGNATNTYSYDAFGNLIASAGNVENDYLFAGEQFDEDLEQYYLRQRYYKSETGRFTRQDTYSGHISDLITLHKYIYANANPVNGVDPSGFATITDSLSIINTISQLAARAYISVANPVVIEQARAWATILAAGIGLLGLVLTETKQDGTVGVKVVPDEWGERNNKHKPGVSNPNDGMNQMRVQVQDAPGHTLGIPIYNIPEMGVTVGQVYQAVGAIWQQRESFTKWLSRDYDMALIKGMAFVTKTAREIQRGGGTDKQGGQQVATVQWDPGDYKGIRATKSHGSMKLSDRKYYRVDFENVRGSNLRVK